MKCVKCGFPKYNNSIGIIWLSEDGYCSVCNNRFKDRKKIIGRMDRFVKTTLIKESENIHLDSQGRKLTNNQILRNKIMMENRAMNIPAAWKEAKKKGIKKIDDFY